MPLCVCVCVSVCVVCVRRCVRWCALIQVECFPLADLLGPTLTHDVERIDFLSLDVEGSEREVLDSFPFDRFDIRVVHFHVLFVALFRRLSFDW
jgi:hypothetical protein